jgi:teichuronic acid biosynthesis glycosyltransferase TuaG
VNQPTVSIIMPAYNAAPFVGEAIESVLAQTCKDWELIVVDDGSTDDTPTILAQQVDSRILVMRQANAGVSAARNAALDVAVGEFVTFMDADDLLPTEALKRRIGYLQANPSVDIANGGIRVTNDGETLRVYTPSTAVEAFFPRIAALEEAFFFGPFYMLRRASIGAQRFPLGITHCEDLCFFLELADSTDLIYGAVDSEVYEYRKHASSAMTNLEGIEAGYLALIRLAFQLKQMTPRRIRALKYRIAAIMAKTWLREARPLRAMQAVFKIWKAAR